MRDYIRDASHEWMTLGMRVRAARLGYAWSERHGAWIRLSGDGPYRVDLQPAGLVQDDRAARRVREHRCWWDNPHALDSVALLARVRQVTTPCSVLVGEHGELIELLSGTLPAGEEE